MSKTKLSLACRLLGHKLEHKMHWPERDHAWWVCTRKGCEHKERPRVFAYYTPRPPREELVPCASCGGDGKMRLLYPQGEWRDPDDPEIRLQTREAPQ